MEKIKISAIIVTYNPSIEQLNKMIVSLQSQVDRILIVDNSDNSFESEFSSLSDVSYTYLNGNMGIAYAQNVGILKSYYNSDFIITFDQDSNVSAGLISGLVDEFFRLRDVGIEIGCIGPSVVNERDGQMYDKYFKGSTRVAEDAYNVRSLISSGTLYPVSSFSYIGLNKADWFIDSIDIEWCYRARSLGYNTIMTKRVSMGHNLGVGDKSLAFGKKINYGAPIRLYYVYRNWLFSFREKQFPLSYKLKLMIMIPAKFIIFSTIKPKRMRVKYMLMGLKDGLLNRSGNYNKNS